MGTSDQTEQIIVSRMGEITPAKSKEINLFI